MVMQALFDIKVEFLCLTLGSARKSCCTALSQEGGFTLKEIEDKELRSRAYYPEV